MATAGDYSKKERIQESHIWEHVTLNLSKSQKCAIVTTWTAPTKDSKER